MTDTLSKLRDALADRYRIERQLGAGGMATVYLAHDVRHDRRVALKVLKPELAAVLGAERFLSEIRTTANLQHPHILPLFDSGQVAGVVFYVMPFVEGETLRERLQRDKQLPIEDALRIAREVGDALQYAHAQGVIHRDIKPENILLQGGHALVADFGIALAAANTGGGRMTETGMSLGTPTYMSPEQAMGERAIDARSDVYALGCVLYEMLLGEAPFTGSTAQAIVAKVLTEKPAPMHARRDRVPPHVEEAVLTALEKLPADRFATAAEFVAAISPSGLSGTISRVPTVLVRGQATPSLARTALVVLITAALGVAVGFAASRAGASGSAETSRLLLLDLEAGAYFNGTQRTVAVTADGNTVVYAVNSTEAGSQLLMRRLDAAAFTPIPNSANAANLKFSPDGRLLYAALSTGTMLRMTVGGSAWAAVPGVVSTPFFDVTADGTHWWTDALGGTIHRTGADGRDTVVFPLGVMQQVLPGEKYALAVGSYFGQSSGPAIVFDLETGESHTVLDELVVEARYAAGFLYWVRPDNALHAAPFDLRRRAFTGEAREIARDVSVTGSGFAQWDVASNGTVVYLPATSSELVEVSRSGVVRVVSTGQGRYHSPRFSPDGARVAADVVRSEGRDVWLFARAAGDPVRVTLSGSGHDPVWTRDGRELLYMASAGRNVEMYSTRLGSTTSPRAVTSRLVLAYTGQPIGRSTDYLVMVAGARGRGNDIARLSGDKLDTLVSGDADEIYAAPSPDGQWFAFVSSRGGRPELFVRSLRGEDVELQVSLEGATEPVWSPDGTELFYRGITPRGPRLIAAKLRLGAAPAVLSRTELFEILLYDSATPHANYDISPDGRHFIFVRRTGASGVVVIQNVPELYRRLVAGVTK